MDEVNPCMRRADAHELLTGDRLAATLHALARVAEGDRQHDFSTVLDVYNDQQRGAGKPALSVSESLQIAHAVRLSLTDLEADDPWASDLSFINRHLKSIRGTDTRRESAAILPGLLRAAADVVAVAADRRGHGLSEAGPCS